MHINNRNQQPRSNTAVFIPDSIRHLSGTGNFNYSSYIEAKLTCMQALYNVYRGNVTKAQKMRRLGFSDVIRLGQPKQSHAQ